MMPEEDSFINKGGSYVDPIAENWEATFIELLATDEGYIVSKFVMLISRLELQSVVNYLETQLHNSIFIFANSF